MRRERDVVVGQVRRRGWERVGYGVHRRTSADAKGGTPLAANLPAYADLLAWQQILGPSACFTHLTAAAVHGMWLPAIPPGTPVMVSQPNSDNRPKRPEIRVMRHTQPIASRWVEGLHVASPDEVLLVCARDLRLLDLVVLGDSALQLGLTTLPRLAENAQRRRWGARRLARAVGWMDGRSESAWESPLRVMHRSCGVRVVPQHEVFDASGLFVARGDLWIEGTRTLHEYDGAVHREAQVHADDLTRDRALLAAGWCRRGYIARDLMVTPEQILRDADASLGRRHRVDRLDPWLDMHRESLFHREGQAAFLERVVRPASGR